MTNDAAVAWRIRISDSHTWGFTSDEDDADFHGKNSGLPYVKEALVPATTVAELRAEVERRKSAQAALSEYASAAEQRAEAAERRVAELVATVSKMKFTKMGEAFVTSAEDIADLSIAIAALTKESP